MDAGINNVIYMELHSGPKMANGTCGNNRSRFHCIYLIRKMLVQYTGVLCGYVVSYQIVNLATYQKLHDSVCIMRSEWPGGLIYGSTAACLLGLRV
jgi:hypothetical protein